jgi:8-oxo-dGTP diphosphatase
VIKEEGGEHHILLITRGKEPFKGKMGFPGGHIDYGEDPMEACVRELREECGIVGSQPELFEVRGKPDRDPRYHMVGIFYLV